ncbi:MAG: AMP-binding protein [Syntrophotalea acetylenica]|jgi:fatty-acyl-CoA synthase|uniref:AMP-binding protein n=1 Tax=Syntrophotalea acetylenica TaxID=29542 RepID=A0A1L3GJH2_SYNAC|nr:AMP-binding protein [Syntrophotalea acetylenica]APG26086.1 AMP-binding protein [Syntrophotalea acetylenica]APG44151.1 AMP-binding protein [Syntrophotalea acetylenica]MDD4456332.1 AMP-binding protein [Syntrophotalea acetylenica]MDY0261174.1 AMP-binding protein [Syntrophotalea acetylenica]
MSNRLHFTMGQLLDDIANRFPDNDALVYADQGLRYSYLEFNALCERVAKGLLALGVRKGDHVAIWATNVPQWVVLQFATAKIGAVLVTVNTNYKSVELEYVLKQSDATTLFLVSGFKDTDYVETLYSVVPELRDAGPGQLCSERLPFLKHVVFLGDRQFPGMRCWSEMESLGRDIEDAQLAAIASSLDEHEVINMQYTSGTTGFPKGVMLTHHNIVNNGFNIGECMRFTEKDRLCIPVPFFHCFGCVLAVLACVTHGSTMVPVETFSAEVVLRTIEAERCTAVHGVPTMFIAELDHPNFGRYDLTSLRSGIMAGSPCPIEVMKRVIRDMNLTEITIAYGQTESSPVITQTRTDDPIELRVATVGRALPDVEVKIVDIENGQTLPPGRQGELCTRGYLVMKGYYKMPEETARVIDGEGWLHTGDLAVMDENGYCKITGRIKNMIIRGGENIYPREIEEFLYSHPKVADVQVYGVPDIKYGEQVMAAIKLKEDTVATAEEIQDFCRGSIANYKVPRYVKFVDEFPMTASGKIQKFKLREMAIKELNLEAANSVETA